MLVRLGLMAAWLVITAPLVGVLLAASSGLVVALTVEAARFTIDAIRIHRDPLGTLSPTDQDFRRHR